MIRPRNAPRHEWIAVGLLAILAGFLFLPNLGSGMFWQDEAQTALVARTILSQGVPKGTDGRNYFSQEQGGEYGPGYIWRWHTWLSYYLVAGFFKVFGPTTAAGRWPFALAGLGCVLMTFRIGKRMTGRWQTGLWAGLILTLSVPFLILSRQCRYYSLSALMVLCVLDAYLSITKGDRRSFAYFVVASTLLFHTMHFYFGIAIVAVLAHALLCRRTTLGRVMTACAVSAAINAPWMLWLRGMHYTASHTPGLLDTELAIHNLQGFLMLIQKDFIRRTFFWALAAVLLIRSWLPVQKRLTTFGDQSATVFLMLLMIAFHIGILTLVAPLPYLRYLTPLFPVIALLMGLLLDQSWRWHWGLGGVALASFFLSQPYKDYAYELTHPFVGPVEGFVEYLNQNAAPNDTVVITYEDLPLKFYTNLRVMGGLTGEDLSNARQSKWVIRRKHLNNRHDAEVDDFINRHFDLGSYRRIVLPFPDTAYQNREEFDEHLFRTDTSASPIVILKRHARDAS